jgi:hypothetical protein
MMGVFGSVAQPSLNPWPSPCNGTIDGGLTLVRFIFSPGCSPGMHVVHGDFVQDPSATLKIEIGAAESDQLVVDGTAYLAGTLELAALDDPGQLESMNVAFLQAGSVQGFFSEIDNTTGLVLSVNPWTGTIETGSIVRCRNGLDDDGDGGIDFDGAGWQTAGVARGGGSRVFGADRQPRTAGLRGDVGLRPRRRAGAASAAARMAPRAAAVPARTDAPSLNPAGERDASRDCPLAPQWADPAPIAALPPPQRDLTACRGACRRRQ